MKRLVTVAAILVHALLLGPSAVEAVPLLQLSRESWQAECWTVSDPSFSIDDTLLLWGMICDRMWETGVWQLDESGLLPVPVVVVGAEGFGLAWVHVPAQADSRGGAADPWDDLASKRPWQIVPAAVVPSGPCASQPDDVKGSRAAAADRWGAMPPSSVLDVLCTGREQIRRVPEPSAGLLWVLMAITWAGSAWMYQHFRRWQAWEEEEYQYPAVEADAPVTSMPRTNTATARRLAGLPDSPSNSWQSDGRG